MTNEASSNKSVNEGDHVSVSRDDPFLSVSTIAKIFDVTPATVREWFKDGKLAGIKINNVWRARQSELDRFANQKYGE